MEGPNPNRGKDWSETEIADLQHCLKIGMRQTQIAQFLSRTVIEVREKAAELVGFSLAPKNSKSKSGH
jgi:hypothetical protein